MMKHSVDVITNITECLNTGQIPVVVADQPLYAELKYLQWALPDRYGDGKLVVLMGGLHIEMSLWNCIGDILENSGWTTVLVEAEVSSPGGGSLLLKSHHLTKTRAAHEVTLLALHKLKMDAYTDSCTSLTFSEWKQQMNEKSATFAYWNLIMQLQAKVFSFVRAQRSMDFSLYVQTLDELAYLYFSLNHQNYARWLSVHIADLKVIPEAIYEEFMMGNFVTNKTKKRFSAMAYDQRHEQNNKILKVNITYFIDNNRLLFETAYVLYIFLHHIYLWVTFISFLGSRRYHRNDGGPCSTSKVASMWTSVD